MLVDSGITWNVSSKDSKKIALETQALTMTLIFAADHTAVV